MHWQQSDERIRAALEDVPIPLEIDKARLWDRLHPQLSRVKRKRMVIRYSIVASLAILLAFSFYPVFRSHQKLAVVHEFSSAIPKPVVIKDASKMAHPESFKTVEIKPQSKSRISKAESNVAMKTTQTHDAIVKEISTLRNTSNYQSFAITAGPTDNMPGYRTN